MIHKILFSLSFLSFAFSGAIEASLKMTPKETARRKEAARIAKAAAMTAVLPKATAFMGTPARQESSVVELNSAAAAALVQKLSLTYPKELESCRLKRNYAFTGSGIDVNPHQGVTVIHFSLPRDRDLFLHPDFSDFISDGALDVDQLLRNTRRTTHIKNKARKAKLFRAFYALTQHTGKTTALAIKRKEFAARGAAPARVTVTRAEINHCALPMPYIASRLFYDDGSEGYMVIQEDGGKAFLRGITWYCPFATWSKGFRWERKGTEDFLDYSHLSSAEPVQGDDDSTLFPRVAELSILCASGCGGDLLRIVKNSVLRSGKFSCLLTDAKETIISFYKYFDFTPVAATARYRRTQETKARSLTRKPYRHWFSTDTPLVNEDGEVESEAHLFALPIRRKIRNIRRKSDTKFTITLGPREYRNVQNIKKRKPKTTPTTVTASVEELLQRPLEAQVPTARLKKAQAARLKKAQAASAKSPTPEVHVKKRKKLTKKAF